MHLLCVFLPKKKLREHNFKTVIKSVWKAHSGTTRMHTKGKNIASLTGIIAQLSKEGLCNTFRLTNNSRVQLLLVFSYFNVIDFPKVAE